jgi:hypothetical protein
MAQRMILRLSPKTATLVGENATEWEWLEEQVRAGRRTTGTRADEAGLRALAAELGPELKVEEAGVGPWRRRWPRGGEPAL